MRDIKSTLATALPLALSLTLVACSSGSEPDNMGDAETVVDGTSELDPGALPDGSLAQDDFLTVNAQRSAVTVTESGLQFEVLKDSDGLKPSASSVVTVHYVGTLLDGTPFDSSYSRGQAATFTLSNTIAGWVEGVQLMAVGSQYRFVIPPDLAYGEQGAGSLIAPGDALIFVVDLLEINAS